MDPRSGDPRHAKPLLLGSREVMKQSKTSLLQGVVLEELKLCQARAVPAWQSQFALTGQTADLPHPFMSSQVPPNPPSPAVPLDGDSHPLPWCGVPRIGRPHLWVLQEVS